MTSRDNVLVVFKVDSSGNVVAQGALLGLVADTRLEITHCFPFPSGTDETIDDEDFQLSMMRRWVQLVLETTINSCCLLETVDNYCLLETVDNYCLLETVDNYCLLKYNLIHTVPSG